ncbi:MAG: hypothetical protein Q3X49_05185, partial [Slackia sp.]|uniref:hypothetical protein n=1 Tax=Slackia sp. TaxID=2049041 RepID=UPI002846E0A2
MRPGKTSITGHTFCPSGKVDSDDFSHKKWALACANAQNQTHYLSYKPLPLPKKAGRSSGRPAFSFEYEEAACL